MSKWLVPENELDRDQRNFIKSLQQRTDNRSIEGFPGSGKTVLLLYAAKYFRETDPNASIVFVEFTHSLLAMMRASLKELTEKNHLEDIPVMTFYEYCKNRYQRYDYVLCDEVQDLPSSVIRSMQTRTNKQVIIAGDRNQSIYKTVPRCNESPCDLATAHSILNVTQSDKLIILHRLTPTIIKAVNCFMPNMDIMSGRHSMMKIDTQIRLWKGKDRFQEVEAVINEALTYQKIGETIGILVYSHKDCLRFIRDLLTCRGLPELGNVEKVNGKPDYKVINAHFEKCGLPIQYVGNSHTSANFSDDNKITLMTFHGSKGLDFDRVFLPALRNFSGEHLSEKEERTLLMVAMTRSRKDLYISYCYKVISYVDTFKHLCKFTDLDQINQLEIFDSSNNSSDDDDDFA